MKFLNMQIFKSGIFKKLRYMFSSPQRMQELLMVSETGNLSVEPMPMAVGFVSRHIDKMSWVIIHRLKIKLRGHTSPMLPVSERSYIGLDPFDLFTSEDEQNLMELDDLALIRYTEKVATINERNRESINTSFWKTIIIGCFCIAALALFFTFIKK